MRDGPDGTFDRVVVDLETPIVEEVAEGAPTGKRIADRIRQSTAGWDAVEFGLEPDLHRVDERQSLDAPDALPRLGCLTRPRSALVRHLRLLNSRKRPFLTRRSGRGGD
jgi:hypothetical protein